MKKHLYSQYDVNAKFFNHVQMSEVEPEEFAENVRRSIVLCRDPKMIDMIKDCHLLHLGTFDDVSGKFDINKKPRLIFDCQAFLGRLIEEAKNGKRKGK